MSREVKIRAEIEHMILDHVRKLPNGNMVKDIKILQPSSSGAPPEFEIDLGRPLPSNSADLVEYVHDCIVDAYYIYDVVEPDWH